METQLKFTFLYIPYYIRFGENRANSCSSVYNIKLLYYHKTKAIWHACNVVLSSKHYFSLRKISVQTETDWQSDKYTDTEKNVYRYWCIRTTYLHKVLYTLENVSSFLFRFRINASGQSDVESSTLSGSLCFMKNQIIRARAMRSSLSSYGVIPLSK